MNMVWYKKIVLSVFWVYLILLICYLLYSIVLGLKVVIGDVWFVVEGFMVILIFFNLFLNLVFYYWCIREVRYVVKKMIR